MHAQDDATWADQHAEIAQVAANSVRFRAKSEPTSAVLGAVGAMRDYATEHALVGSALMGPLDICAVRSLLRQLNPHNLLLTITAKPPHAGWQPFSADASTQATEPHYGFSYATAPFSAAQLTAWGARFDVEQGANGWRAYVVDVPLNAALTPPPPNEFIPTDFNLKCGNEGNSASSSADDPSTEPEPKVAPPSATPEEAVTIAGASSAFVLASHALDFPFSGPCADEIAPVSAALRFSASFPKPLGPERWGRLESFHRTDDKFKLPKTTLFLRLALPRACEFTSDPHRRMLVTVLLSVLDDVLQVCRGMCS